MIKFLDEAENRLFAGGNGRKMRKASMVLRFTAGPPLELVATYFCYSEKTTPCDFDIKDVAWRQGAIALSLFFVGYKIWGAKRRDQSADFTMRDQPGLHPVKSLAGLLEGESWVWEVFGLKEISPHSSIGPKKEAKDWAVTELFDPVYGDNRSGKSEVTNVVTVRVGRKSLDHTQVRILEDGTEVVEPECLQIIQKQLLDEWRRVTGGDDDEKHLGLPKIGQQVPLGKDSVSGPPQPKSIKGKKNKRALITSGRDVSSQEEDQIPAEVEVSLPYPLLSFGLPSIVENPILKDANKMLSDLAMVSLSTMPLLVSDAHLVIRGILGEDGSSRFNVLEEMVKSPDLLGAKIVYQDLRDILPIGRPFWLKRLLQYSKSNRTVAILANCPTAINELLIDSGVILPSDGSLKLILVYEVFLRGKVPPSEKTSGNTILLAHGHHDREWGTLCEKLGISEELPGKNEQKEKWVEEFYDASGLRMAMISSLPRFESGNFALDLDRVKIDVRKKYFDVLSPAARIAFLTCLQLSKWGVETSSELVTDAGRNELTKLGYIRKYSRGASGQLKYLRLQCKCIERHFGLKDLEPTWTVVKMRVVLDKLPLRNLLSAVSSVINVKSSESMEILSVLEGRKGFVRKLADGGVQTCCEFIAVKLRVIPHSVPRFDQELSECSQTLVDACPNMDMRVFFESLVYFKTKCPVTFCAVEQILLDLKKNANFTERFVKIPLSERWECVGIALRDINGSIASQLISVINEADFCSELSREFSKCSFWDISLIRHHLLTCGQFDLVEKWGFWMNSEENINVWFDYWRGQKLQRWIEDYARYGECECFTLMKWFRKYLEVESERSVILKTFASSSPDLQDDFMGIMKERLDEGLLKDLAAILLYQRRK